MDNSPLLWMPGTCPHSMHRPDRVPHSSVPSFTPLAHRATRQLRVTAFTRSGNRSREVAEQWTGLWRSCGSWPPTCGPPVDNLRPVLRATNLSTACGIPSATNPHPADMRRSTLPRVLCGQDLDNSAVPRVWTDHRPVFCGRRRDQVVYSNATGCGGRRRATADSEQPRRRATVVSPVDPAARPASARSGLSDPARVRRRGRLRRSGDALFGNVPQARPGEAQTRRGPPSRGRSAGGAARPAVPRCLSPP